METLASKTMLNKNINKIQSKWLRVKVNVPLIQLAKSGRPTVVRRPSPSLEGRSYPDSLADSN